MKYYFKYEKDGENETSCEVVPFTPEKFEFDIFKLKLCVGEINFRQGLVIETSLSELLEICPRDRRRTDSYAALVKFLKEELEIELNISNNRYGTIADTSW